MILQEAEVWKLQIIAVSVYLHIHILVLQKWLRLISKMKKV